MTLVLIGADVDPRLAGMREPPIGDIWDPLDAVADLERSLGSDLPRITWLIRADDTIRHVAGSFEAGFLARHGLWDRLRSQGHELGWHFHHWTYGPSMDGFDPSPPWLPDAFGALSKYFEVSSTRTGWDYANSQTIRAVDALGVRVDFSALPGHLVWWTIEGERIVVDWRRAPRTPYHPSPHDYQRPDVTPLSILEVPITSFRADTAMMAKRAVWRALHGVVSFRGLSAKTYYLTQEWPAPPASADVLAFYFHPSDLTTDGIANAARNLTTLRRHFDPEFVTGRDLASRLANRHAPSVA